MNVEGPDERVSGGLQEDGVSGGQCESDDL